MELENTNGIGSKPRPRRNDALEQAKLEGPRRRRIFIMYHGVKDPANLLPTMMTGIRRDTNQIQGWTKITFPGFVNMR